MYEISNSGYTVKVIEDSLAPSGVRLTTIAATYQRFIHSEVLTHRELSRNSASSRAIPAQKLAERVKNDPALPVWFGKNQSGMQAAEEVEDKDAFLRWWLEGRDLMLEHHAEGIRRGYHKQIVNRVIEPWMKITVIITATRWNNLLFQRDHKAAMPEFQKLAGLCQAALQIHVPTPRIRGEWHMPYIRDEDFKDVQNVMPLGSSDYRHPLLKISVGRCARVSYLNHEGVRDPKEDIQLCDRLEHAEQPEEPGHWSPFEHQAMALEDPTIQSGNINGWMQLRKCFSREYKR